MTHLFVKIMPRTYRISVAGHVVSLNIDKKFESAFLKDYALFLTPANPQIHLEIEVSPGLLPIKDEDAKLELLGKRVNIAESYFSGSLDLASGGGQIKINPVGFLAGLGQFLRNAYSLLVIREDRGIVLHAAAILRKEEAYIFIGPSGAGKSTVAKLSADRAAILGDDLVIIKKVGVKDSPLIVHSSQKKNIVNTPVGAAFMRPAEAGAINGAPTVGSEQFMVFPTPNWGDRHSGKYQNRAYPINKMFKLIQDKRVYLEKFSPGVALAQIFTKPQAPLEGLFADEMLERFRELVSAVPFYGLHFLPEPSFWDVIEGV